MNEKQIQELVREWTARAEECQKWEAICSESDPVTPVTAEKFRSAKEVYKECARELWKSHKQ